MNPTFTVSIDLAKRKTSVTGLVAVGEKVDVVISGIDLSTIPEWEADNDEGFIGPALRFRLVTSTGKDLVRFPLADGDKWTIEGDSLSAEVDFNTMQLREWLCGFPINEKAEVGIIIDSVVDAMEYGRGTVKILQWAASPAEDPTILPDWRKTLRNLNAAIISIGDKSNAAVLAAEAARVAQEEAKKAQLEAEKARDLAKKYADEKKGDPGEKGDPGPKGEKGDTAAHDLVPCDEDGAFYRLVAVKNENGEMVLALEQEKSGIEPNTQAVLTTTDQTIDGVKIFLKKIKGTIESADTATKATQDGNGRVISDTYLLLNGSNPIKNTIKSEASILVRRTVDNSYIAIIGGTDNDKGAKLVLVGKDHSDKGLAYLESNDGTTYVRLLVRPDGRVYTYKKDGKMTYFAKTVNNIAADSNGNVTLPLNFLPLAGGLMTGGIDFNKDVYIKKSNSTGYLALSSGAEGYDGGGAIVLRGKDAQTGNKGEIILVTYDGTNRKSLNLRPDGTLTWGSDQVAINNKAMTTTGLTLKDNVTAATQSGVVELAMQSDVDTKAIRVSGGTGWSNGGSIVVYGKGHTAAPGMFRIKASNDTNQKILEGNPNGTLLWGGKCVPVIQSGSLSSGTSVTFPTPFRDTNYIILKADGSAISGITKTTSGFTLSAASTFSWIAIGAL